MTVPCPAPGGLSTSSVPSSAPTRSARPRSPVPVGLLRAADAVVADLDHRPLASRRTVDARVRRVCVLGHVGQRLGDDEVGRGLDRDRQPLLELRSRARPGSARGWPATPAAASRPRWLKTAGWIPAARSRSSPTAACALANALSSSSREPAGSESKRSRASCSSIISATSRCWAPSWRSRPSRRRSASPASTSRAREAPQRLEPRSQLDLQPRVLDRQRRRSRRLGHELGRLGQHGGVQERADATALVVDLGHDPVARRLDGPALAIDVAALGQPVGDLERRIAERTRQGVTYAARVVPELLDQAGASPTCGRSACAAARPGTRPGTARTRRRTRYGPACGPRGRPPASPATRSPARGSFRRSPAPARDRGAGAAFEARQRRIRSTAVPTIATTASRAWRFPITVRGRVVGSDQERVLRAVGTV